LSILNCSTCPQSVLTTVLGHHSPRLLAELRALLACRPTSAQTASPPPPPPASPASPAWPRDLPRVPPVLLGISLDRKLWYVPCPVSVCSCTPAWKSILIPLTMVRRNRPRGSAAGTAFPLLLSRLARHRICYRVAHPGSKLACRPGRKTWVGPGTRLGGVAGPSQAHRPPSLGSRHAARLRAGGALRLGSNRFPEPKRDFSAPALFFPSREAAQQGHRSPRRVQIALLPRTLLPSHAPRSDLVPVRGCSVFITFFRPWSALLWKSLSLYPVPYSPSPRPTFIYPCPGENPTP